MLTRTLAIWTMYGATMAVEVSWQSADITMRPGSVVAVGYNVTGAPLGYTASLTFSNPANFTGTVTTSTTSGMAQIAAANTELTQQTSITITVTPTGGSTTANAVLTCSTLPAPVITAGDSWTLSEDAPAFRTLRIGSLDLAPLSFTCSTASPLTASVASTSYHDATLSLSSAHNVNSVTHQQAITVHCVVSDAVGPTPFDIPVTITPTNDPPAATLAGLSGVVMDPERGLPVAVCSSLTIRDDTDLAVTLSHAGQAPFLAWTAEVSDGVDGVDVLSLCGDAGYLIDGSAIRALPAGTAIAAWAWIGGSSRRLQVELTAAGSQAQLQELVRLLRYAHLQSPAHDLVRSIAITVVEPNGEAAGTLSAPPVTATCTVQAVNRQPAVTLAPLTVEPDGSGRLALGIVDSDGLDNITVSVIDPLPVAGRLSPLVCTGSAAVAAGSGIRYAHTVGDLSDDRITLSVSDGRTAPVLVSTTVAIRTTPERVSIVSDPPLEVVRGQTLALPVRILPSGCAVALADYGLPMPGRPAGLSCSDGALHFDWSAIPAGEWIAWAVEATGSGFGPVGDARNRAVQRVLVRVRDPLVAGVDD